jgi:signal transduction histidine kinase
MEERYATTPILAELPPERRASLLEDSVEVDLAPGEFLFREGDPARYFYVVLDGELEVTRNVDGQEVTLNTYSAGHFTGEMSLILDKPYLTTVRALKATRLLRITGAQFRKNLLDADPSSRLLLPTMAQRIESADVLVHQRAKLAALGKMAAGLAHELNNPAAAALRASSTLREAFQNMGVLALKFARQPMTGAQLDALNRLQAEITTNRERRALDPITQADREDEISTWLEDHGASGGWEMAPVLVRAGFDTARLDEIEREVSEARLSDVLSWVVGTLAAVDLLDQVETSSKRISELVAAIKDYSYMDQAALKEIDLHDGLEKTLMIMQHALKQGVRVVRDYDYDIPRIWAYGSELNQVWTNIIDNAVDAMEGKGTLTLRTRREGRNVVVEIEDNGPGIPPDVQLRIFEPFFTTKGVGEGNGLGLDISYKIVVNHHHGDIKVYSQPGKTTFRITLPVQQPDAADSPPPETAAAGA